MAAGKLRSVPGRLACAALAGGAVLGPVAVHAQAPPLPGPAATQEMAASVGHSALKGVTLKAMTVTTSFLIFTAGTGSAAAGGVMAALNGIGSYLIYVGNDYAWDSLYPNTNLSGNEQGFGVVPSLSRNTLKFITLKPVLTVLNVGVIYAFTDTLAATAATSTAAIVLLPGAFYLNNTLWDWYDWSHAPPANPTAKEPPSPPAR